MSVNDIAAVICLLLFTEPYTDVASSKAKGLKVSNSVQMRGRRKVDLNFKMLNQTRQLLIDFFIPFNKELSLLLGDKRFEWGTLF